MSSKKDIGELLDKILLIMKESSFPLEDLTSLSTLFSEAKKATDNLIIKAREKEGRD